jgi:hypothetical protein
VLHASQGIGSDEYFKAPKQALQCWSHFAFIEPSCREGEEGGFLVDPSIGSFQVLTYGHDRSLARDNKPHNQFHWRRFDGPSHEEIPFDGDEPGACSPRPRSGSEAGQDPVRRWAHWR